MPLTRIQHVQASYGAFAALRHDGAVVAWGDWDSGGNAKEELRGVTRIQATENAFAAIKATKGTRARGVCGAERETRRYAFVGGPLI